MQIGGKVRSDFFYQFAVQHVVVFVQYHDSACGQAFERAVGNGHTVINSEVRITEVRQVLHVFQAFGAAETCLETSGSRTRDGELSLVSFI